MKNSEVVMEHITEGTSGLGLPNAICIFQDIAYYKSEKHLPHFASPVATDWFSWQCRLHCSSAVWTPSGYRWSNLRDIAESQLSDKMMRIEILTATNMKMSVFWDSETCGLVDTDCLRYHVIMEEVTTSETSVNILPVYMAQNPRKRPS
jgi:hypothetical protein